MGQITIGELEIDPDDLKDMNTSELVLLCRMGGHSAHHGLGRKTLTDLLLGKSRRVYNTVDNYRRAITEFLRQHWGAVSSQVDVKCHARCMEHTDYQVMTCWKTNKDILERYQ